MYRTQAALVSIFILLLSLASASAQHTAGGKKVDSKKESKARSGRKKKDGNTDFPFIISSNMGIDMYSYYHILKKNGTLGDASTLSYRLHPFRPGSPAAWLDTSLTASVQHTIAELNKPEVRATEKFVELTYMEAAPEKNEVVVKWTTASEKNNDHFTLQRSLDSEEFEDVKELSGYADRDREMHYSARDPKPHLGMSFYRIKYTNSKGEVDYSPVTSVVLTSYVELELAISPNPNQGDFSIELESPHAQVIVELYDVFGQIIYADNIANKTGKVRQPINLSNEILSGVYYLKAHAGSDTYIKQVNVEI